MLAAEVRLGLRDALELDEGAEAGNVVDVDAHVLVEQQPPALVDDDEGPEGGVERVGQGGRVVDLGQAVVAGARLVAVGADVRDEARARLGPALLLAQLEASLRPPEVRVALRQDALVGGAEGERALERRRRVGVARLDLDVAAGRGHALVPYGYHHDLAAIFVSM